MKVEIITSQKHFLEFDSQEQLACLSLALGCAHCLKYPQLCSSHSPYCHWIYAAVFHQDTTSQVSHWVYTFCQHCSQFMQWWGKHWTRKTVSKGSCCSSITVPVHKLRQLGNTSTVPITFKDMEYIRFCTYPTCIYLCQYLISFKVHIRIGTLDFALWFQGTSYRLSYPSK